VPEPGVEQHVAHVLEPHLVAVQQVGRLLVERQPAGDVDLGAAVDLAARILEGDHTSAMPIGSRPSAP